MPASRLSTSGISASHMPASRLSTSGISASQMPASRLRSSGVSVSKKNNGTQFSIVRRPATSRVKREVERSHASSGRCKHDDNQVQPRHHTTERSHNQHFHHHDGCDVQSTDLNPEHKVAPLHSSQTTAITSVSPSRSKPGIKSGVPMRFDTIVADENQTNHPGSTSRLYSSINGSPPKMFAVDFSPAGAKTMGPPIMAQEMVHQALSVTQLLTAKNARPNSTSLQDMRFQMLNPTQLTGIHKGK